jgi:NADP-dependent 3-hydroxy acid dehydrogenase YdfG
VSLDGRACLVTGASSGIGRAVALALAREGARVWAVGRNEERLRALAAETREGAEIVPVVADVESDRELEAAASTVLAASDGLDVLVHSAGAIYLGTFGSASPADLDRQYRVNLRAPFLLTQALLPALRRARGQVVFVNSSAALRASAGNVWYAATKAGLKALADGLRDEVNRDGVRVVTLYVGRTATPMQESVHEHEGRPYRSEFLLRPEDVAEVVLAALSLPASGEVTDVNVRPMSKLPDLPA